MSKGFLSLVQDMNAGMNEAVNKAREEILNFFMIIIY